MNLRRCREERHYTVEEVRQYLRLGSLQAIYKWEEGRCFPQTDTMLALMELYKVQIADILYENQRIQNNIFESKESEKYFPKFELKNNMFLMKRYLNRMEEYLFQVSSVLG